MTMNSGYISVISDEILLKYNSRGVDYIFYTDGTYSCEPETMYRSRWIINETGELQYKHESCQEFSAWMTYSSIAGFASYHKQLADALILACIEKSLLS